MCSDIVVKKWSNGKSFSLAINCQLAATIVKPRLHAVQGKFQLGFTQFWGEPNLPSDSRKDFLAVAHFPGSTTLQGNSIHAQDFFAGLVVLEQVVWSSPSFILEGRHLYRQERCNPANCSLHRPDSSKLRHKLSLRGLLGFCVCRSLS